MHFLVPLVRIPETEAKTFSCRSCGADVASEFDTIEILGRPYRAVYRNPFGIAFEVLTLARARNTQRASEPTEEHTWFPGYAWSLVTCAVCGEQMGWAFDAVEPVSGPQTFFGLQTDKMTGI
jgi:cereblon